MPTVAIAGGGIGGLSAALLLARAGHRVIVCERDPAEPPAEPDAMWSQWPRPGTPQARLGHTFLPGFRQLLAQRLPDVLAALRAAGAPEVDYAADLPGERIAQDDELQAILCRRPVLEGILRLTAAAEPGVELRPGCTVHGLSAAPLGLLTDAGEVRADAVIVAAGRRVQPGRWFAEAGAPVPAEQEDGCGFFCFTRYFRAADGDTAELLTVSDTGFLGYEMVGADAGTYCIELEPAVGDEPLRELRRDDVHLAVARALPGAAEWLDRSEPIGPVAVMGNEQNLVRRFVDDRDRPALPGVLVIGDARARTNSVNAWGAGMALQGAVAAADAIAAHPTDPEAQVLMLEAAVGAEVTDRHRLSTARDRALLAEYRGEPRIELLEHRLAPGGRNRPRNLPRRHAGREPARPPQRPVGQPRADGTRALTAGRRPAAHRPRPRHDRGDHR